MIGKNIRFAFHVVLGVVATLAACATVPPVQTTSLPTPTALAPMGESQSIIFPAHQGWQSLSIFVREGQEFEITATGAWNHDVADPAFAELYSPSGVDVFDSEAVLPSARIGTLLGRIGDNPPFVIGEHAALTADYGGHLWLGINDHPDTFSDNMGELEVTIKLGPRPVKDSQLLTNEQAGYLLLYPAEYHAVIYGNNLCLTPAEAAMMACHVANAFLEVSDADGRTLEELADEAAAQANPDIEVTRTNLTVAGEEAILLDNIYAADVLRKVVILHGERVYTWTFVPWSENETESSKMDILYKTVIHSFEFQEQAAQPAITQAPDLSKMTVTQLRSTSPNGEWRADALLASLYNDVPTDYARLTLTHIGEFYEEWRPYEEWSETGLGDSFISQFYWSPDGRYLYFTHSGGADGCGDPFVTNLHRVDLQDRSLSEIPLDRIGLDIITLSPELDRLAYRVAEGFLIRSLETDESYILPYEWREEHDYLVGGYAWSPDGKTLAFTLTQEYCVPDPSEVSGTSIQLIDLETGAARTLTDHDPRFLTVTGWPQPGKLQVYQDGSPYIFDIASGTLTPDPTATAVN